MLLNLPLFRYERPSKLWKSRVSLQRTRDKHKSRFDLQNDRGHEKNDNAAMHVRVRTLNESFPVLKLYYNQAQSSLSAKRAISSTKVVL